MDVRRYIISNPTMVKNADGIVEAYKPGEHVMVMAADFDAVAKERDELRARLAESQLSDAIHLEALATSEALRVREQREAFCAGYRATCPDCAEAEAARRYPDA